MEVLPLLRREENPSALSNLRLGSYQHGESIGPPNIVDRGGRQTGAQCMGALMPFSKLSQEALADYALMGVNATWRHGAKLFQEDTASDGVFVLKSGQVKLSCTSKDARTLILRIALPGEILGLSAVVSTSNYEVTAEAVHSAEAKVIPQLVFLAFLKKHGGASLHVARMLSAEYHDVFCDARRLALSESSAARLSGVLLAWGIAQSIGKAEMSFTMTMSHTELGNVVGCARETVTRLLGRFRRENLIVIRGMHILIPSPEKLERMSA